MLEFQFSTLDHLFFSKTEMYSDLFCAMAGFLKCQRHSNEGEFLAIINA